MGRENLTTIFPHGDPTNNLGSDVPGLPHDDLWDFRKDVDTPRIQEIYQQQRVNLQKNLTLIVLSYLVRTSEEISITNDPVKLINSSLRGPNQKTTSKEHQNRLKKITGDNSTESLRKFFLDSIVENLEKYWDARDVDPKTDRMGTQIAKHCQSLSEGKMIESAETTSSTEDTYVLRTNGKITKDQVVNSVCRHFGYDIPEKYQDTSNLASPFPRLQTHKDVLGKRMRLRQPRSGKYKL